PAPARAAWAETRAGCVAADCHAGIEEMHQSPAVKLGCTECHGGDATAALKEKAHVQPRFPKAWPTSANPPRAYTLLNREDPAFVRFVNPSDLRAAPVTCGRSGCHPSEVERVSRSMMTTGAMLWGAALYNNGAFPLKDYRFGESYAPDGSPRRLFSVPPPTPEETRLKGVLPFLDPLPRFEIAQPGNVLRVFERGGRFVPEVGLPIREEEPGRPDPRLSTRGFGTLVRTDPVFLGLQKTRLLDPMLSFPGTNDHAGDYRASGCAACHVVYANDRDAVHSGPYAPHGNRGQAAGTDRAIPRGESGHPIRHTFTRAIPTSACMVCHMHPGTAFVNTYLGTTWWDQETDGEALYPPEPARVSPRERRDRLDANPEEASLRGKWSDPEFLAEVSLLNPTLRGTQFADYHGHGWIFRKVYKQDRKGNLLDAAGTVVPHDAPDKFQRAVHLRDIHLEKGMHCVDCHFEQDSHGDNRLYGETRNAVEIDCVDCHGTVRERARLTTSGPASAGGKALAALTTPSGRRRFQRFGDRIVQRSMVEPSLEWEVSQVLDSITPSSPSYNERSRLAKTLRRDGAAWGDVPADPLALAHPDEEMTCFACHSSWVTSCFGCHVPMKANEKTPLLHDDGRQLRNWTSYNPQVVRDEVFMLGIDGTVTGRRIAPVRSSSAVLVSSQNQNRDWIYAQQQTVSAEGYSGQVFNTHVPHTVRRVETKTCTDCHVSRDGDNNAIMAQLLGLGTNAVNFMGRRAWVAAGHDGVEAITVTEIEEPQAVIGSRLHELAYPGRFARHQERGGALAESHHHDGRDTLSVALRGEYLYAADGPGGLRVFDVAAIENKGFSERIVTAPVSPLGQDTRVPTRFATAVASPSTLAVDPARTRRPENEEQPIHPFYAYLYVTDRHEGLILVNAATLLDGDPRNNFLERALTFNPHGVLDGAVNLTLAGHVAYVLCDRGLVAVSLDDPLRPRVTAEVGTPHLDRPLAAAVQFRYAFVVDARGLKVLDVTDLERPAPVAGSALTLEGALNLYVARTWGFVAAGPRGLAIVDLEKPERPRLDRFFDAGGVMNDVRDVKVAMTNVSLFAYVADGENGLRVVQLTSARDTPGHYGFSPPLSPRLIASRRTHGPALALSKGLDRDRSVDESGHQVAVFGRRGARPFTRTEMERMYLRGGRLYTVTDLPPGPPRPFALPPPGPPVPEPVIERPTRPRAETRR
ncbi:MAG TPA: hypothetical protein VJV23_13590, partial [Candidatus Polarisedimenticolia bacterium]|nr:hypothetical protein [Candidatus Polarisedimenticolia bacterium]